MNTLTEEFLVNQCLYSILRNATNERKCSYWPSCGTTPRCFTHSPLHTVLFNYIYYVKEMCLYLLGHTECKSYPGLQSQQEEKLEYEFKFVLPKICVFLHFHTHIHTHPPPPKIKNTDSSQFLWIHIVAPYIIYVSLVKLIFFLMI